MFRTKEEEVRGGGGAAGFLLVRVCFAWATWQANVLSAGYERV